MQPFTLEFESRPDAVVAHLNGDASTAHADDIHAALSQLAAETGPGVVIDLKHLDFIASIALAELIELYHRLRQSGRPLRLCGAQPQIAEVFEKTRLVEMFPMYDTLDAAIKAD